MRSNLAGWITLIAFGVWLALGGAGCGKGPEPVDHAAVALKLPGATNVLEALAKKDYEGAIAAWAKLKDSVSGDEQRTQFTALTRELRNRLAEASSTDPKATEAFEALRAVMSGR